MKIEQNKVGAIHYTLTNDTGEIVDSSQGKEPLFYIHGFGNLIPGLEKELEGKVTGDSFSTSIEAADGYGDRREELIQEVPKSNFKDVEAIEAGMQFQAQGPEGAQAVTVTGVNEEIVTVDANHPLAGQTLHFQVEITEVRDASQEELDHGHVHGPGGHEH